MFFTTPSVLHLRREEKALAEAAALRVWSKRLEAIFPKGKGEDA